MPGISNRVLKSSVVEKESETTNSSVAGGMTDSGDNGAKINEIEIVNADKNELEGLSDKVKKQRKEEDLLCKTYKSFLRLLTKNAKKGVNSVVSGPSPSVSGKCLIQFLLKKPNSNYRGEILRAIISSAFTSSDVTIAEEASKAFSEICRADENGDHTLEILQLMAELVKKNMKSNLITLATTDGKSTSSNSSNP